MDAELFDPPRWPGGPFICIAANLPSFETAAAARNMNRTLEGDSVDETWECKACGMTHAGHKYRPPSGATSGSGRVVWPQKHYESIKVRLQVLQIERPA